jgi:CPA2 family monovalent cation:H+ antiporter-2
MLNNPMFTLLAMHLPLLNDILILLSFSVFIVLALQRLRLPSIIGFLVTGAIIGPYGLSLVKAVEQVELLSEVGVILLLFVIGMELSLRQIADMKRTVLIGGGLQVGLTVSVAAAIYHALGDTHWNEAVFAGFLFSLSSTAIVLKMLQDRNELNMPHGRNALSVMIFQDIIVVPMMLFTPIMAGDGGSVWSAAGGLVLKTALVLLVTLLSARYLVPRLFHAVAKTRSKELFLLVTFTLCFAVAALTSEAGLSLALGAFLAGLIISESEYSHQATSIILPFRELFTSFFFVSVGMLLDMEFFLTHLDDILLLLLAVVLIKSIIAGAAMALLGYPARTVMLTGMVLFQVGEFAFILSKTGIAHGLLSEATNQYFLSVSILSMVLTPFMIMGAEPLTRKVLGQLGRMGWHREVWTAVEKETTQPEALQGHLVIIGYGMNGKNLSRAARYSGIPYVVIELDAELVKRAKGHKVPIVYGDATHVHILESVQIQEARSVVIAISDPRSTASIVREVRDLAPSAYLIVRTRYVKEIPELKALGADEVIPEEFETSIEIFAKVLDNFLVPDHEVDQLIGRIRSDNYELFQSEKVRVRRVAGQQANPNIGCVRLGGGGCRWCGRSLSTIPFNEKYGVRILGISRGDAMIEKPDPAEVLRPGDILFLSGRQADIEKVRELAQ